MKFGEEEIRTNEAYPEPFPLYPYETLSLEPAPCQNLCQNEAFVLECLRPFKDERQTPAIDRFPTDKYLFRGPGVYIPSINERVERALDEHIIARDEALTLVALRNTTDSTQQRRIAGEKWNYTKVGSYLPAVDERVEKVLRAHILTDCVALHLSAQVGLKD